MAINWVNDLGAPLAVTAVDLVVETTAPDWAEWAAYGMAGVGWVATAMNWAGDFTKNFAIAATPGAARQLYERVRGATGVSSRVSRRMSRWPAPTVEKPFGGARLI